MGNQRYYQFARTELATKSTTQEWNLNNNPRTDSQVEQQQILARMHSRGCLEREKEAAGQVKTSATLSPRTPEIIPGMCRRRSQAQRLVIFFLWQTFRLGIFIVTLPSP